MNGERETEKQFIPVGVELCPRCSGQNLSWCLKCFHCGHDFIDPLEEPEQDFEDKAGAAC